jgi:hypothetical protein
MNIAEILKNNTWKITLGSSGTIITLIGALFTVDARYAHAADVAQDKVQTHRIIHETTQTLRRQMLEDKLFELDIKRSQSRDQKLSPIDQALRDRYQRQLEEATPKKKE